jgi:hypothetical protein
MHFYTVLEIAQIGVGTNGKFRQFGKGGDCKCDPPALALPGYSYFVRIDFIPLLKHL